MSTSRVRAGTPAGGQFAASTHAESSKPLDPATWVSIDDPDDPTDLPVFEGRADRAGSRLVPGIYTGTDGDDRPVVLTVTDGDTPAQKPLPVTMQTPMSVIDARLQAAYTAGDEEAIQQLSTFAAARIAYEQNEQCATIDLDWGDGGLHPVAARTAFGDPLPPADDTTRRQPWRGAVDLADSTVYTTNLRPGGPGTGGGRLRRAPDYAHVPFQLDVHRTLGVEPF